MSGIPWSVIGGETEAIIIDTAGRVIARTRAGVAALIVRAVNEREGLLKLLRLPRKWIDGYPAPFDVAADDDLEQMEKFLRGLAAMYDATLKAAEEPS